MSGRIVVGIDGSVGAERAMAWALREAERRGAGVRLVHTYLLPTAVEIGVGPMIPTVEEDNAVHSYHREVLDRAVGEARDLYPLLPIEAELVEGPAAPTLVTEGEEADLVVVGARGASALTSLLLGSVSAAVVRSARCPVVIVPIGEDADQRAPAASGPGAAPA